MSMLPLDNMNVNEVNVEDLIEEWIVLQREAEVNNVNERDETDVQENTPEFDNNNEKTEEEESEEESEEEQENEEYDSDDFNDIPTNENMKSKPGCRRIYPPSNFYDCRRQIHYKKREKMRQCDRKRDRAMKNDSRYRFETGEDINIY